MKEHLESNRIDFHKPFRSSFVCFVSFVVKKFITTKSTKVTKFLSTRAKTQRTFSSSTASHDLSSIDESCRLDACNLKFQLRYFCAAFFSISCNKDTSTKSFGWNCFALGSFSAR